MSVEIQRFNGFLDEFLSSLNEIISDPALQTLNLATKAMMAKKPGDPFILNRFSDLLQNAADFIATKNTELFTQTSEMTNLLTKEDITSIIRSIPEEDLDTCWQYVETLYEYARIAKPDLHLKELELHENLQGWRDAHVELIKQQNSSEVGPRSTLLENSLKIMLTKLINFVHDNTDDESVQTSCLENMTFIEANTDFNLLMKALSFFYQDDIGKNYIIDAKSTVLKNGIPFVLGEAVFAKKFIQDLDADETTVLLQTVQQLSSLYVFLITQNAEMIYKVETIMKKIFSKIDSEKVDIHELSSSIPKMLRFLQRSGVLKEVYSLALS